MLNINDYLLNFERRIPNVLLLWSIIGTFIIICLLIINSVVKINDYYQINGVVKDQRLSILVPVDKVRDIINNNQLYLDNTKYSYTVNKISNNIVQESNGLYQEVFLNVELNDKNFIDNSIVKIKFIIDEKTILKYIFDLIKGED